MNKTSLLCQVGHYLSSVALYCAIVLLVGTMKREQVFVQTHIVIKYIGNFTSTTMIMLIT